MTPGCPFACLSGAFSWGLDVADVEAVCVPNRLGRGTISRFVADRESEFEACPELDVATRVELSGPLLMTRMIPSRTQRPAAAAMRSRLFCRLMIEPSALRFGARFVPKSDRLAVFQF